MQWIDDLLDEARGIAKDVVKLRLAQYKPPLARAIGTLPPGRNTPPGEMPGNGFTPADGSVTTVKLADGAVTEGKLSFDPATQAELDEHADRTDNPHLVTAAQVGRDTAQWNADRLQGRTVASTLPGDGQALVYDLTTSTWKPGTVTGGGHTIQDEGSTLPQRAALNFVGSGVTATDDSANDRTLVTIPGGVFNAGATPSIQAGLEIGRPTAGTVGRLYISSDGRRIYRDSGSAWVSVGTVNWGDLQDTPLSFTPSAHASSHHSGGSDPLALGSLAGELSDAQHGSRGGGTLHAPASGSAAGFMSASDYTKLSGIAVGAQPGTVTSVGLSMPSLFSVTGTPITTNGTLSVSLTTQSANQVLAGPTTGAAATPTFRALVAADLPSTIARLNTAQNWTATQTMRGAASNNPATFRMMPDGTPSGYKAAFEFWRTDEASLPNYERIFMVWDYAVSGLFEIRSEAGGTGTARPMALNGAAVLVGKSSGLTAAGDLDVNGRARAATFETSAGNKWTLGGYTAGAVTQAGYVSVVIDGVTRRLLVG